MAVSADPSAGQPQWGTAYQASVSEKRLSAFTPVEAAAATLRSPVSGHFGCFDLYSASFEKYSTHYSPLPWGKWVARKFAITLYFPFSIAEAIYHVASALFESLKALFGCSQWGYAKLKGAAALRDLQEGAGHLITLVWDRGGDYLIEKAVWYKQYYRQIIQQKQAGPGIL